MRVSSLVRGCAPVKAECPESWRTNIVIGIVVVAAVEVDPFTKGWVPVVSKDDHNEVLWVTDAR